uniref:Coiled-coil domain containing 15 n=1 Tax=Nothobranchius kadleci TaxID=1051664 RepID=A0A1A8DXW5_NOTKA
MSVSKVQTLTHLQNRARVDQNKELIVSRTSKVLAARNQAVVAVGAWVESGQDLLEHPSDLALLTDELQTEKRQKKEESLRRFQDEVRHRVAQRANIQRQQQPHINSEVTPHIRIPHHQVWEHQVSARKGKTAAETTLQQRSSPEPGEVTRQVRLRLAACRTIQPEETMSDLPGGRWNSSSTRRRDSSHMHRPEEDVLEEEEEEKDVPLFISQHECPLVQQKMVRQTLWDPDESHPDPGSKSRVPQVLWPLTDQEKVRKQRQSQFLMHRRQEMNSEREHVKEKRKLRKHLQRTASMKAEKEKLRLEEERRLERIQQLSEVKRKLEERELLIQARLKLEEEEEERAVQLQRSKIKEEEKDTRRYVEALRAQMKERLSLLKLEPPPLCCCASSFWDSHPDTCANNCVFHNNPKAYATALHSAVMC